MFFSSVCDSALFNWFVSIVWCMEMIKSSNRTLLFCFPYFLLFLLLRRCWRWGGWSMQTTHPSSSCSHNRNDSSSWKQGQSDPADYFWLSFLIPSKQGQSEVTDYFFQVMCCIFVKKKIIKNINELRNIHRDMFKYQNATSRSQDFSNFGVSVLGPKKELA